MESKPSGAFTRVDGKGGLDFNQSGCCSQPSCKYFVISCICFFPTLGIGSCIAMAKMKNAPILVDVSSNGGATQIPRLELNRDLAFETNGDFRFGKRARALPEIPETKPRFARRLGRCGARSLTSSARQRDLPSISPPSPLYLPCISPGDQLDATGKLDLLLLVCARVAAGCCAPDRGNHSGQNV